MNTSEKLQEGFEKSAEYGISSITDYLNKNKYLRNTLGGAALGGLGSYLAGRDATTGALGGGILGAGGTYLYNNERAKNLKNFNKLQNKLKSLQAKRKELPNYDWGTFARELGIDSIPGYGAYNYAKNLGNYFK